MSEKQVGKIDIKVGTISFSAEGDQDWLAKQLEKVLQVAATAGAVKPNEIRTTDAEHGARKDVPTHTLAAFIKEKNAGTNQTLRFLATAAWLETRGETDLTTASVTEALSKHRQAKLANPSQCLNSNVTKGLCEKKGKTFYITPAGLASIGEQR